MNATNLAKFAAAMGKSDILAKFDAGIASGDILNDATGRVDMRSVKGEVILKSTTTTADGTVLHLWRVWAILEGVQQKEVNLKNDTRWTAFIEATIKPWLMAARPDATWVNPKTYAKAGRETVDIAADDITF